LYHAAYLTVGGDFDGAMDLCDKLLLKISQNFPRETFLKIEVLKHKALIYNSQNSIQEAINET